MRTLFLHEVNYLEKPIFEMHEFPEHLAALGHEVAFVQFPEGLSLEQVKALGWKTKISGRVVSQQSITLYTPQNASGTFLGRLKTALTFSHSFSKVIEDFSPDVVVSFSVPTSGWQALRISQKHGIPYVFRALDVSHKIRKSPFSQLIKLAERYIYRNASWVSANNPAMARYCIQMGANAVQTVVDLPPLDLDHFSSQQFSKRVSRASIGIHPDFKVTLYMGSFFYFSGLPELIERFAELHPTNTKLILIGGGEQEAQLKALVSKLNLEQEVLFTGFIPYRDLPRYLSAADVAINPMQPSLVSHAAFPNKVIQYMATGLPVASTRLDGLELTFGRLPGLRFSESSRGVMDLAIEFLTEGKMEAVGESNRQIVLGTFSRERTVKDFEKRIRKVLQHNG